MTRDVPDCTALLAERFPPAIVFAVPRHPTAEDVERVDQDIMRSTASRIQCASPLHPSVDTQIRPPVDT